MLPNPLKFPLVQKVFNDIISIIVITILMLIFAYFIEKIIELLIKK